MLPLVALTMLTAGCRAAATPSNPAGPATVGTRSTDLGQILVDSKGRTLYLFEQDEEGESYCFDACAAIWPPYPSDGQPQAVQGADASMVSSIERPDGERQVTYAGHPLYYYVADNSVSGSLDGQDITEFGAAWYVVGPDGSKVEEEGGSSS